MKLNQKLRSILGLETVKAFIVVLLALAIIGIVALIVLGTITTNSVISQTGLSMTRNFNETLSSVTEVQRDLTCNKEVNAACSNVVVVNNTDNRVILEGNRTLSNCQISYTTPNQSSGVYNNSIWRISGTCVYRDSSSQGITNNVSSGIISFYNNAPTFFALLAVVVIILIISLVVVVVNRFGGVSTMGGGGGEAGL